MRTERTERNLFLLSWEQFSHYWSDIRSCLARTPDFYDLYTEDWLQEAVAEGTVQVWVLSDGSIKLVFFTRVDQLPMGKVVHLFWGAGQELDKFLDIGNDMMDKFASRIGAKRILVTGRPGWWRKLRHLPGVDLEWVTVSRPVLSATEH